MPWSRLRFVFGILAILLLTGCPPEFEDGTCTTDADCFVGEVCNATTGTCTLEPADIQPEIGSFTASPNPAPPNSSVTLTWETSQATGGTLSDENGEIETLIGSDLLGGSYTFDIGTESRTFTLEVVNGVNVESETITVGIDPPEFSIDLFEGTPNPVEPGESVTLSWQTTNVTAARITGGPSVYEIPTESLDVGTVPFNIDQNTTFTLEVESVVGDTDMASVTIMVEGGQPVITAFDSSESAIVTGDSVDLSWTTMGADTVSIETDGGTMVPVGNGSPDGGTVTVTPAATTRYTLTASNSFGMVTAEVVVNVEEVIDIVSFTTSAGAVTEGDSVTLGWETTGSPTLTLENDQGAMIDISAQPVDSGAIMVTPTTTTTYTLTASTALQNETANVTVAVIPPPPTINSFTANPSEVVIGSQTTLSWDISGANSINIVSDLGTTIPTNGLSVTMDSVQVTMSTTRTFTLTATSVGGSTMAQVTVVAGNSVAVTNLTATPNPVAPGDPVTIDWMTANANSIELESDQGDTIDLTGKSIAADSVTVNPSVTTTYTLTAYGLGGPASRDVIVTVQDPVTVDSFTANPTTVVGGNSTDLSWQTSNATTVSISYVDGMGATQVVNTNGKNVASDSVTVTPTETTTYTISADGFQGPATETATVTVQPPVTIDSLTTDRTQIAPGEAATISWTTSNATALTLTDSGGASVDLTGLMLDADSVAVTPSADETYTLEATGPGGPVTSDVTIAVVDPSGLTISEIVPDPSGGNDMHQWVEIANTGSSILDLSNFSLGAGAAAYDETLLQLNGSLPPGGCVVVGGPSSNANNGSPSLDISTDINPDLPAVGGVALFVGPTGEQSATRTPVASVVYGGSNPNGLLDPTGSAATDISPAATEGSSLSRTSSSGVFVDTVYTPGQCFHIESVAPSVGSNQATGDVTISGFGFDVALDTFTLGTTSLTGCTETAGGVTCTVPTTTDSGSVDLTVSRVNEYVSDGSGGTMVVARTTPVDGVLANAYLFETELTDPGATYYCGISAVSPGDTVANATDVTVTLEVFLQGETDVNGVLPAGYVVESLAFAGGAHPATLFDASWTAATAGAPVGNNATFTSTFNESATSVEVAFRVSPDSGASWYYCDTNANSGSDNGYDVGGGQLITWQ